MKPVKTNSKLQMRETKYHCLISTCASAKISYTDYIYRNKKSLKKLTICIVFIVLNIISQLNRKS